MSKRVHFVGISGSGASAVAAIAQSQGYIITGCDISLNPDYLKPFPKDSLFEGHSPNHLLSHPGAIAIGSQPQDSIDSTSLQNDNNDESTRSEKREIDILAISPAILSLDPHNPEVEEAKKRGIEVLTWQEFMGKFLEKDKFVIAVCGTHGKSTTTAMIAKILEDAGLDPTVELGAVVSEWGGNFRIGKSKYFITEADEFNNNYLVTHADISVVTSIEYDHPEFFSDFEAYKESFETFLNQTKHTIVGNISDPGVAEVLKWVRKSSQSEILDYSKSDFQLTLQLPGNHNILNASAAFQVGLLLGIDPQTIKQSLENFSGIGRRFELIGEVNQAKIYSDYAHNPTKVKSSIEGAHDKYPGKKISVVFQPHMFTRTKALFNDFVKVFQNAPINRGFIVDIFASREIDPGDISSRMLVEAIDMGIIEYIPTVEEAWNTIKSNLDENDIVIFIGAGDIDSRIRKLIHHD